MKNLIYVSIYIENKQPKLKIIRETGIFEKKYLETNINFEIFKYHNIDNFIEYIMNEVYKVMNAKRHYKWTKYDIKNIKYLYNMTLIDRIKKRILVTNINESTVSELMKIKYDNNKSYINLNSLDKYTVLIDFYITNIKEGEYNICAKLYSENGNMCGNINISHYSDIGVSFNEARILIENVLTHSRTRILIPSYKTDIAMVSNNAYLFDHKIK